MSSVSILVAVAGDDESRVEKYVETIETLKGENDLSVDILHVYSEDDIERIEEMYDIGSREKHQLGNAAKHNTAVSNLIDGLRARDIDFTTYGAIGDAGTEVIELAREQDVDFVLIGGRKRSPTGKALFGSTAQDILLNASMPVISCGVQQ
ncbi:universal stress protein [Salinibaculum salinum]|uniref:universal stress protein n=1 Tax=Salinibaculum salinum TaxID=3131996 RepID=UPI0030EBDB0B